MARLSLRGGGDGGGSSLTELGVRKGEEPLSVLRYWSLLPGHAHCIGLTRGGSRLKGSLGGEGSIEEPLFL